MLSHSIGFLSLIKRETHRFCKVYVQTIVAPLLTNILFLAVFGATFQTRSVGIEGVDYLSFLVPGLCAMGTIFGAYQNPSSSIIAQKMQGTIQDLNAYPLSSLEKTLAFVISGSIRGLIIGSLTYLSTTIFVGFSIANPLLFFISLTLLAFIFASLGVISGLLIESWDKMSFITSIILTPLAYLGGVFFEISQLPGIFSNIAYINPLSPLIDLVRWAYLGSSAANIPLTMALVCIIFVIVFSIALRCIQKGVGLKN